MLAVEEENKKAAMAASATLSSKYLS